MDITKKAIDWQSFSEIFDSKISTFFKQFKIGTLTHDAHIYKTKGYSAISIFIRLFLLPFIGTNIYREIVINDSSTIKKDAIYNFLSSHRFSWRKFLLKLAFHSFNFIDNLTNKNRDSVFIIDDSTIERNRSKKVELLAKVFDHSQSSLLKVLKC